MEAKAAQPEPKDIPERRCEIASYITGVYSEDSLFSLSEGDDWLSVKKREEAFYKLWGHQKTR